MASCLWGVNKTIRTHPLTGPIQNMCASAPVTKFETLEEHWVIQKGNFLSVFTRNPERDCTRKHAYSILFTPYERKVASMHP